MVLFTGIFQLPETIPPDVARIVWEKTRVEVACVLMVTATLSDGLYPLPCRFTVWVLSYVGLSVMARTNELLATFSIAEGATWSTEAAYLPASELDPGNNTPGEEAITLDWCCPEAV